MLKPAGVRGFAPDGFSELEAALYQEVSLATQDLPQLLGSSWHTYLSPAVAQCQLALMWLVPWVKGCGEITLLYRTLPPASSETVL